MVAITAGPIAISGGVPWGERHCHNRDSEPLPISEIKNDNKMKGKATADVKAPGWEYGVEIQKMGILL